MFKCFSVKSFSDFSSNLEPHMSLFKAQSSLIGRKWTDTKILIFQFLYAFFGALKHLKCLLFNFNIPDTEYGVSEVVVTLNTDSDVYVHSRDSFYHTSTNSKVSVYLGTKSVLLTPNFDNFLQETLPELLCLKSKWSLSMTVLMMLFMMSVLMIILTRFWEMKSTAQFPGWRTRRISARLSSPRAESSNCSKRTSRTRRTYVLSPALRTSSASVLSIKTRSEKLQYKAGSSSIFQELWESTKRE